MSAKSPCVRFNIKGTRGRYEIVWVIKLQLQAPVSFEKEIVPQYL